jgi:hypothetical protein
MTCAFAWFVVAGCGGGTPALPPDAGVDAGLVIAEPAPPLPAALTPCPAGWREVTEATGLVICDPWPATGYRTDCAWDEAHFAGTPGCTRVGTACPADGWPADLPTDRAIVYVDDDATPGGDGVTRATAFTTIRAAIGAAPSGAIVAVATGRYDEAVRVAAGITLWGACVSGTRIVTSAPSGLTAALTFNADGGGVRNLGIDAPERSGIDAIRASSASIESVVVAGARAFGLFLDGSTVGASDVVVRGTREQASDREFGDGIFLQGGSHLTLSRALLDDNKDAGLFVSDANTLVEASDVVVRGTREQASSLTRGRGIAVSGGAHLVLSRALIDDNRLEGIIVTGVVTSMEASDIVVRGTRGLASDGSGGRGVEVNAGAHVTLFRARIDDTRDEGIIVAGAGTSVDASDLVVRGTREQVSDGNYGQGVLVNDGAHLILSRALLDDNREGGLVCDNVGTSVEASDVVVRGTREPASTGAHGVGLIVERGAHLVLSRALIEDNREVGVDVSGAATIVDASDAVVRGTRERASDNLFGRGINVTKGAHLALSRALIEDNRDAAILASDAATSVEASDVVVRDTSPMSDGTGGNGLWAQLGARVVLAGARIERSHFVGIGSVVGASVEARDVVVSGVEASGCQPGTCVGDTGGFGVVAIFGGTLTATRFTVEDATLCGVMVGRDDLTPTGLDLDDGVIDRTAVGACVQQDGYDTARLQVRVEYRDVGVPLRATTYAIPTELAAP